MKFSIYQMEIVPGNPQANMDKVEKWVEAEVQSANPDIIVLPEMWTTSYTLEEIHIHADPEGKEVISFLQGLSVKHNINIVGGSFATNFNDEIYNTAVVTDRKGEVVYQYDKLHLVPMLNEPKYLTGGKKAPEVFELEGVKMGLIICYDLRFAEIIRPLALEGAQVLFVVAEWPTLRIHHWKNIQVTRAIENQMFVVSCNNVGTYENHIFGGTSQIVNPWGETLAKGSEDKEESVSLEINVEETVEVREKVPVFSSRVPALYKQGL